MKHRRLDKYVTLYSVCREGGKVIYSYVETLPQHRLQDRSLKEFYRQVEEHGYDVITPSDKDYEQVVKALNAASKKDAMKDEMSSYNHYKPEEICTCGRWIFFELICDLCQQFGTPGNELGLYVPQQMLMKLLVGSDSIYYRGNVISMERQTSDRLLITTEADKGEPLLYALRCCFENLTVEMQRN